MKPKSLRILALTSVINILAAALIVWGLINMLLGEAK